MNKKNYVVAIDLGSSKIAIAVAEKQSDGLLNVVSLVSKPVKGVNAGRIDNIELVGLAIGDAVKEIETKLDIHIKGLKQITSDLPTSISFLHFHPKSR